MRTLIFISLLVISPLIYADDCPPISKIVELYSDFEAPEAISDMYRKVEIDGKSYEEYEVNAGWRYIGDTSYYPEIFVPGNSYADAINYVKKHKTEILSSLNEPKDDGENCTYSPSGDTVPFLQLMY